LPKILLAAGGRDEQAVHYHGYGGMYGKVYRSVIGQAAILPEEQKFDSRSIKYTNKKVAL
jgi:hypothetical protein